MTREIPPLEPNPVIEAYKKDVDRTLIRDNLRLTPRERLDKLIAALKFVEEVREASRTWTPRPR